MTTPVGRWRAAYTPGDWIVLSGPTSVVVLEPVTEQWASLVPALWDEVVGSSSLVDLAAALAGYRIDTMPSFAALFWTEDGMRSLVRGAVRVVDPATGSVIADGDGIQTWSEAGHDGLQQVRVEMPAAEDSPGPSLSLPLVVGAVRASSLILDASEEAQVFSPQDGSATDEFDDYSEKPDNFTDEAAPDPDGGEDADTDLDGPDTQLMTDPFQTTGGVDAVVEQEAPDDELPADDPDLATSAVPGPGARGGVGSPPVSPELLESIENGETQLMMPPVDADPDGLATLPQDATVLAVHCPYGHPSPPDATVCRVCSAPVAHQQPRPVRRPVLALLRASDGSTVEVDRAVLLGRAPSANPSTAPDPRLMTVPSPGHDISRTHVEIAPEDWQIVVTDLRSTNGTVLVRPGSGERQPLPPGEPVPVPLQSLLELGDGVSVLIDFPQ